MKNIKIFIFLIFAYGFVKSGLSIKYKKICVDLDVLRAEASGIAKYGSEDKDICYQLNFGDEAYFFIIIEGQRFSLTIPRNLIICNDVIDPFNQMISVGLGCLVSLESYLEKICNDFKIKEDMKRYKALFFEPRDESKISILE